MGKIMKNGREYSGAPLITGLKVKAISWIGTGTQLNSITFPEKPKLLLSLSGISGDKNVSYVPTEYGMPYWSYNYPWDSGYTNDDSGHSDLSYSQDMLTMTMYHEDQDGRAQCNVEGVEYTLFYVV